MKKIITFLLVMIILTSNLTFAAPDEVTKDMTKTKANEVTNKDKSITGKITVTDDVSKYTITKKSSTEISISKEEAKGEHTKSIVCVPKSELHKIDIDGDKVFGILNIDDNGVVTHSTATEAELVAGKVMTFSTNIVNGYSGYKQYTFSDVESGDTLNIDDVSGNYTIAVTVDGTIPTYTTIDKKNVSTYPSGASMIVPFNSNASDISGNANNPLPDWKGADLYTDRFSNPSSALRINASTEYIEYPSSSSLNVTGNITMLAWTKNTMQEADYGYALYKGNDYFLRRDTIVNDRMYGRITTNAGTKFATAPTSSLSDNTWDFYCVRFNKTASVITKNTAHTIAGGVWTNIVPTSASVKIGHGWTGSLDDIIVYPRYLSNSEVSTLYAGGSGISFQPEPSYNWTGYNVASGVEKVLNTDATTAGIEYVDTTGGTHDITVTVYFTEDTTLLSETVQDGFYQNGVWHPSLLKVSMEYTPLNNMTSGTITYEYNLPANSTSAYVDDLVSNDSGAIASINSTHLTVHTTTLTAGQTYTYDTYIAFVYDSYTDEPNAMYRTSNKLAEDIDAAFLLAGILFTVCIGVAILGLLVGLATGRIDISAAVTSVGILIISEIFIVIGIVVISYMFGGMI